MEEFSVFQLVSVVLRGMLGVLVDSTSLVFFWIVMAIVFLQYRRISATEGEFTKGSSGALLKTMRSLGQGILGGFLGSMVLVLTGASVGQMGLSMIWIVALILAMFDVRLMCFSYAGGVVGALGLIFGWDSVDPAAIGVLVGALHLVEAGLILTTGGDDAIPTLVRGEGGLPAGAFAMQRFWPVPLAVGIMMLLPKEVLGAAVLPMPDWWPLLRPAVQVETGMEHVYALISTTAVLGYSELAVARTPARRARSTALLSGVFSAVLLGLSLTVGNAAWGKWLICLFSPVGHELMVYIARRQERTRAPIYQSRGSGLMVLHVIPGSPADQAGLASGDLIEAVNCQPVNTLDDIRSALELVPFAAVLDVRSMLPGSKQPHRTLQIRASGNRMGMILVPDSGEVDQEPYSRTGLMAAIVARLRVIAGKRGS